jgi:hypothetical protein
MCFNMNTLSRTITGIVGIVLGLVLTGVGFFQWVALIYGIPLLILGILLLLNKNEDNIEGIKSSGGKK